MRLSYALRIRRQPVKIPKRQELTTMFYKNYKK